MNPLQQTAVIIPAYNEAQNIGLVLQALPREQLLGIVVVDNNSQDDTAAQAQAQGAIVLTEKRQGYGHACLKGIDYWAKQNPQPQYLVFLDGDFSDYPEEIEQLVQTLDQNQLDLVIGSRTLLQQPKKALQPVQRFGNWLATRLLKYWFKVHYSDLGPFRALRFSSLLALDMQDKTYGWTIEMQAKAALAQYRYAEVPLRYRPRAFGQSKVSGTIKGSVLAGYKILSTLFYLRFIYRLPKGNSARTRQAD